MPARARLAVLAPLLLAGCLALGPPDDAPEAPERLAGSVSPERLPAPTEDFSRAIDPSHGGAPELHAVAALHTGAFGLELVGYNPLTRAGAGDPPHGSDSAYTSIDVWKNLVCVGHWVGSGGLGGGATIVDIADPASPKVLASIPSAALNADCQFTDDGRFLLLASYGGVVPGNVAPAPANDALAYGVSVWDVADPTSPKLLLFDSQGEEPGLDAALQGAYHSVFTAEIGGADYVFQTYANNVLKLAEDGRSLEIVSRVEHADHDMWVGRHPVTGGWVMVTGLGDGTVVYGMDDPSSPVVLGAWEPHDGLTGWHRQWPLKDLVGGRALLVVAGEECAGSGRSLPYTVIDWTDPTNLVTVGSWQVPGKPENAGHANFCTFSAHEFETWDGYVATGNYHAGVWLFDVGTAERAASPVTLGYYLPHEVPQRAGGTTNVPWAFSPSSWGAYFDERGYVITADWSSGLYVLKFGATKEQ